MIPAQTVTAGEVVSVDVASYFNDPDGDALTYSAATSNPAVASPTVSGTTLTFAGVSEGAAAVTVTATDPGGLTATQNVSVTVQRPNAAPTVTGTIAPQVVEAGGEVSVNLAEYFGDPDGDALTFSASSSSVSVATTRVAGSIMTVAGAAPGGATVTATATDPRGLSASQDVPVTVEEPSMDREILRTLFINASGGSWDNSGGWLTEAALDAWYGVKADARDRVTALELPDNNLQNEIPGDLGGLARLVRLDLSENDMEGRIPRELGDLEHLEWLDLSNSLFFAKGTIPTELGNLKKLKHLDLSGGVERTWLHWEYWSSFRLDSELMTGGSQCSAGRKRPAGCPDRQCFAADHRGRPGRPSARGRRCPSDRGHADNRPDELKLASVLRPAHGGSARVGGGSGRRPGRVPDAVFSDTRR